MKSRNRVLLSCIVASLVASSGYAASACGPAATVNVISPTTTTFELTCDDSLNVTSAGSIKVSTDPSTGVFSTSTGDITNSGVIQGTGSSGDSAQGINQTIISEIDNIDNTITNSGTISATTDGSSSSIGIKQYTYYGDIAGSIVNSGTITTSSFGETFGILQESYGNINGTITNSGTITASSSGNANGIFQYSRGDINGAITNSGTITASDNGAEGIYQFSTHGNINGTITNSGTITVTGDFGAGVRQRGTGNGTITNTSTGTITAYSAFWLDPNESDGSSGSIYTSTIINQGTIDTTVIQAPLSALTNSGIIKLNKHGQTGLRTFTQTSTGTLSIDAEFEITDDEVYAIHPSIYASDSVSIADGSTIHVNVIGHDLEQTFLDQNETIDGVVKSGGEMTVNPDNLNVTDNSDILDFEAYMDEDNSLGLKLIEEEETPVEPPVEPPVVTPEERPEIVVAAPTLGAETLNVLNTIVQKREYSASGLGGGDIAFADKHFWFKPFGVYTKQDDKNGKNGFDANTYGFGIGVDGEYTEGKRAGLAFFYSNSSLDINNVRQESDLDAFNLIAYGSQPIVDDQSRVFYQGGFGLQKNTSKRYLVSQTAKGDYTSRSFYAEVKAVKYYVINDKLTITPAIEGSYRYFHTPSYSETGAGANNLNVQSSSTSQVLLGASSKFEYKINDDTHFISNVALNYDFNNDASSVNAAYQGGGAVFNTAGIKNSAFSYELGLGIARKVNKDLVIDLKYDLYGKGNDFMNHAVLAKLKWSF